MQRTLFSDVVPPDETSLVLFHDERKVGKQWLYHGVLLVPEENVQLVLAKLGDIRALHGYCGEVHFAELRNLPNHLYGEKCAVARDWIRLFLDEACKLSYFSMLGVDLTMIDWRRFGQGIDATRTQAEETMYYRFLEMAVYSACRWFFGEHAKVRLQGMFKDKGADRRRLLERVPSKLSRRSWGALDVQFTSMQPIDSDHEQETRIPEYSHIIQYVDVLIGSASQVLDNSSRKAGICCVASEMVPWVKRATQKPYNPKSEYYKRYALSFFPKVAVRNPQLSGQETQDSFYHNRRLLFCQRDQKTLWPDI